MLNLLLSAFLVVGAPAQADSTTAANSQVEHLDPHLWGLFDSSSPTARHIKQWAKTLLKAAQPEQNISKPSPAKAAQTLAHAAKKTPSHSDEAATEDTVRSYPNIVRLFDGGHPDERVNTPLGQEK